MAEMPLVAVLAAGQARRFGGGKLDADCAGKPLGRWALDAVAEAGLRPGLIVVGSTSPVFANDATDWTLVVNPDANDGLGTSVRLAVGKALFAGRDLLILLADMPLVTAGHLKALIDCETSAATRYPDGATGVPVCLRGFDVERVYDGLGERRGAASIIRDLDGLTAMDAEPDVLLDVDTSEQLERVAAKLRG
ncbi:hypothetical protein GCM10023208_14770 [Erythrobacter westpacificensis]|uniref:MobA-like NTP transferase domain-containing protein n=1 Tax=Erythrobacter westpacificensis TaxID=1055231 RepID=A0ABP9KBC1_9SPHN